MSQYHSLSKGDSILFDFLAKPETESSKKDITEDLSRKQRRRNKEATYVILMQWSCPMVAMLKLITKYFQVILRFVLILNLLYMELETILLQKYMTEIPWRTHVRRAKLVTTGF